MPSRQLLSLTEDLTIYHALEQKNALLAALAGTDDLELDLMHVGEIDTAGLQLLILLKGSAARRQDNFHRRPQPIGACGDRFLQACCRTRRPARYPGG